MNKRILLGIFLIALALATVIVEVKAQANGSVTLTLGSNKNNPTQYPCDAYSVFTLNQTMKYTYVDPSTNEPTTINPTDGLVGVQIQDQNSNIIVIRTLSTGSTQPYGIPANITAAYLSNGQDQKLNSVAMPTGSNGVYPSFYFNVTNNLGTEQSMLVTLNVYDSNGVPIAYTYQPISVDALSSGSSTLTLHIPSWAHYGTANAYVDVYDNAWPSQGGYPIAEEYNFQFTITDGTAFQGIQPTTQSLNGDPTDYFSMSFRLPQYENLALGTYTAYSTTNYDGVTGSQTTTFGVAELADITGSGTVNFNDIVAFVALYINYFANGVYSSTIDFIHNGKVINFNDVVLFVAYYIQAWSS